MKVQEFYILYDTKRPPDPAVDYAGNLSERDCDELWDMMHG